LNERKYAVLGRTLIPDCESLKDTRRRTLNYFYEKIAPQLSQGKTVLVSAHGNSLRALVMGIERLTAEEIVKVEIPTGEPIVYDFDSRVKLIDKKSYREG